MVNVAISPCVFFHHSLSFSINSSIVNGFARNELAPFFRASSRIFQEIPPGGRPNATHRMDGVYIINGPQIIPGYRNDLKIADITPTIYHLMSLPLPAETDGRVAKECFLPDSPAALRGITSRHYGRVVRKPVKGGKRHQEDLKQKLHALGYI